MFLKIGGHILHACSMDQNKEKTSYKQVSWDSWFHHYDRIKYEYPRIQFEFQTLILVVLESLNCYHHFQTDAVHVQTFNNRCSKCPPCRPAVKHDAALFILWYLKWIYRENIYPRTHVCMKFLLCCGPCNAYRKCGRLFQKHPVQIIIADCQFTRTTFRSLSKICLGTLVQEARRRQWGTARKINTSRKCDVLT
jgi:hypothetical protein